MRSDGMVVTRLLSLELRPRPDVELNLLVDRLVLPGSRAFLALLMGPLWPRLCCLQSLLLWRGGTVSLVFAH